VLGGAAGCHCGRSGSCGLDSTVLVPSVDENPDPIPFRTRPCRSPASEASVIRHDFGTFDDWRLSEEYYTHGPLFGPSDHSTSRYGIYADKGVSSG
jgi:hypothetical protein